MDKPVILFDYDFKTSPAGLEKHVGVDNGIAIIDWEDIDHNIISISVYSDRTRVGLNFENPKYVAPQSTEVVDNADSPLNKTDEQLSLEKAKANILEASRKLDW